MRRVFGLVLVAAVLVGGPEMRMPVLEVVVAPGEEWNAADLSAEAWGYGGSGSAFNSASPFLFRPDSWSVDQALVLPGQSGDYASASIAATSGNGLVVLEGRFALRDWTPSANQGLVGAQSTIPFQLVVETIGTLQFRVHDGTSLICDWTDVAAPPFANGEAAWLKATYDPATGAATVHYSLEDTNDPDAVTWTLLDSSTESTGTLLGSTRTWVVGDRTVTASPALGAALRVRITYNGVVEVDADFTDSDQFAVDVTSGTDDSGNSWTINQTSAGAVARVADNSFWLGTGSEYGTVTDRDELDYDLNDTMTLAAGFRTSAAINGMLIAKGNAVVTSLGYYLWLQSGGPNTYTIDTYDTNREKLNTTAYPTDSPMVLAAEMSPTALTAWKDGTSSTTAATLTSMASALDLGLMAESDGGYKFAGEYSWAALFSRALTAAEHTELGGWDGTVATEPNWLRNAAVFYWNADDAEAAAAYIADNEILNLATSPWRHISADWQSGWQLSRGQDISDSRPRAARLSASVNNDDRDYDPEHADGPYYGNFAPLMPIRVRAFHSGVTHGLFRGFITGWPNSLIRNGKAVVDLVAYDGLSVLQNALIRSVWDQTIDALDPLGHWALSEAAAASTVADTSGNDHHGVPTGVTFEAAFGAIGGFTGTAASFDGAAGVTTPAPAAGTDFTLSIWFRTDAPDGTDGTWVLAEAAPPDRSIIGSALSGVYGVSVLLDYASGSGQWRIHLVRDSGLAQSDLGFPDLVTNGITPNDGLWHHIGLSSEIGGRRRLYVDGTEISDLNDVASWGTGFDARSVWDFGIHDDGTDGWEGDLAQMTVWDSALDEADLAALYPAGANPWDNELTSARITNILDAVGWPAALRSIDTGLTTMRSFVSAGVSALDAIIEAVDSEHGRVWVDGDGNFVFQNREARSVVTVDDVYADESNHDGSDVRLKGHEWTRDDLNLYSQARVSSPSGVAVQVGSGPRVISRTSHARDLEQLRPHADLLAAQFGTSRTRFDQLSAQAFGSSSAGQWAAILGRDLSDLLSVEISPIGGGDPIDFDGFVDRFVLTVYEGRWEQSMQLTAADGQRVFTFDDSTIGVFDGPGLLGW